MDSLRWEAVNYGERMKPCLRHGCPELAPRGKSYCGPHDPGPWAGRGTFASRYGITRHRWDKLRLRTLARDGGRCVDCGSTDDLEADHVVPRAQGGSNQLANLATRCHNCHLAKTAADRKATR